MGPGSNFFVGAFAPEGGLNFGARLGFALEAKVHHAQHAYEP